jgi:hypothetical protein
VIQKCVFSTDTISTITATTNGSLYGRAGGSTANHGYVGGGQTPRTSSIDKLVFATEVRTTISASLYVQLFGVGGFYSR